MKEDFDTELTALLNKYSVGNDSDTPDFLLAEYLIACLINYKMIVNKRHDWHKAGLE